MNNANLSDCHSSRFLFFVAACFSETLSRVMLQCLVGKSPVGGCGTWGNGAFVVVAAVVVLLKF